MKRRENQEEKKRRIKKLGKKRVKIFQKGSQKPSRRNQTRGVSSMKLEELSQSNLYIKKSEKQLTQKNEQQEKFSDQTLHKIIRAN